MHPGGISGTGFSETVKMTGQSWKNMVSFTVMQLFLVSVEVGVQGRLWASVAGRKTAGMGKVYYPVTKEHNGKASSIMKHRLTDYGTGQRGC